MQVWPLTGFEVRSATPGPRPCPPAGPDRWESPAFSSRDTPAPAPESLSLGCISRTVRNSFSEVTVRKPISALGCRPYR